MQRPRIAVTLSDPERATDGAARAAAATKNALYLAAVERAGAEAVPLTETATGEARQRALAAMDGLLISGGADLDPARYGQPREPRTKVDPGRDAIDAAAWAAARERAVPVLGICRGMQAINVFSGGSLLQHVEGHRAYGGPPARHPIEIEPRSALGRLVGTRLEVNSFHHQAVSRATVAPGLRATAVASHGGVEIVEALEADEPNSWLLGVQCHPERTETSPPALEVLWRAFAAACAGTGRG